MAYKYQDLRHTVFSEEGVAKVVQTLNTARFLCASAGAVSMSKLMADGDAWQAMAVVDYLVEVGVLEAVTRENVAGQHRVFRWIAG